MLCKGGIKFIRIVTLYTISKPTGILKYLQLTNTNLFRQPNIIFFNQLINVGIFIIVGLF